MAIVHHANWVLPIAGPPVENGWVAVENGRIASCGSGPMPRGLTPATPAFSDSRLAILPSLVNAHTHLELSWMHGRVPASSHFGEWMEGLVLLRRQHPDTASAGVLSAIREAIAEAKASGTGLVGDISNTLATVPLLRDSRLPAHVFHELIGFNTPASDERVQKIRMVVNELSAQGGDVKISLAPHAPYSVSPALFRAIRRDLDAYPDSPTSVHLAEPGEELELLATGHGAIRDVLEAIGAWDPGWTAPACRPVEYIERCGMPLVRTLVVHGVRLTDGELERLRAASATLVTCPRSNRWTGAGDPPIARFYASGVRVAIGTDSLASVDSLNMFDEIAAVHALAPGIAPRRVLESATKNGAEALGFGREVGTIEPGKRASLIAVRVPPHARDVEEYLVGGVPPADVRWLDEHPTEH